MNPPMPESTPTPGSGVQQGRQPGSPRIRPMAMVLGILALVIVLGVVTGLIVMVVRDRANPDGPVPPPVATTTPGQADTGQPNTGQPNTDPAVSVENLPTSGDLTWPKGSWNSGATSPVAGEESMSPCQTWRPSELAGLTGSAGREFTLQGPVEGRGHAYVLSFAGDAEVTAAYERLMTDGEGCAARLGGRVSPRQDASAPWGSGEFVDVTLPGPAGDRMVSWGVGRVGTRLVWLVLEADGTQVGQADPQQRDSMISSLPKSMQRLR